MTAIVGRTNATPAPGQARFVVPEDVWRRWTRHLQDIRTCQHCGTMYRHAAAANVCEHYHEGL